MTWPELYKAKKNAQEISQEIDRLLKEHNSLFKKEIAKHGEKLADETTCTLESVEEQFKDMMKNLKNHKKQMETKSRFLQRHNSRFK